MPALFDECQPLLRRSWAYVRQRPILHFRKFILGPLVITLVVLGLSRSQFVSDPDSLRQNPTYVPLSLTQSVAYQECFNATESANTCYLGVAPDLKSSSSSIPPIEQSKIFDAWLPLLRQSIAPIPVVVFNSSSEIQESYTKDGNLFAGLVLDASQWPNSLTYDVRLPSALLASQLRYEKPSITIPSFGRLLGGALSYATSGFAALQTVADVSLSNLVAKLHNDSLPSFRIKSLVNRPVEPMEISIGASRGPHSEMTLASSFLYLPATLMLAFGSLLSLTYEDLLKDRFSGWKAYMALMGMRTRAYWLSKAIFIFLSTLPILGLTVGMTIGLQLWWASPMKGVSDPSLAPTTTGFPGSNFAIGNSPFFLTVMGTTYLCLFALACIAYALMIGVVAPNPGIASLLRAAFFIAPFLAQTFITSPLPVRLVFSVIAPLNFLFSVIELLKRKTLGKTGPTLRLPPAFQALSDYPIIASLAIFIFDTVLYIAIALVVSHIRSRRARRIPPDMPVKVTKPKNKRSHLLGNPALSARTTINSERVSLLAPSLIDHSESLSEAEDAFEIPEEKARLSRNYNYFEPRDETESTSFVIEATNLEKLEDGKDAPKVPAFSLKIEAGIYVLLGEQKNDFLGLLSGLERPSSGNLKICGYDAYREWDDLKRIISVCPKNNITSDDITGRAQVELAAKFRCPHIDDYMIDQILGDLGLAAIADQKVETYSAGQKRCLMLACALSTPDVRLVFIDEASTDMSLEQRRAMWKLLMRKRDVEGVSFVLTTNHTEDAEVLADRIAIVHKAEIIREGSLEFLMRGMGYHIKKSKSVAVSSSSSSSSASSSSSSTPSSAASSAASYASSSILQIDDMDSSLEVVPVDMRHELPARIRALQAQLNSTNMVNTGDSTSAPTTTSTSTSTSAPGASTVCVFVPTFEDYLTQLYESLDESHLEEEHHNHHDSQPPGEEFSLSRSLGPKVSPLEIPNPRRASGMQQFRNYSTRRARASMRFRLPNLCFLFVPLIILGIGLGLVKLQSSGQSLRDVPKALSGLRSEPKVYVDIALAGAMPAIIPYAASNDLQIQNMLDPAWTQSLNGLQVTGFQHAKDVSNFIWRAISPSEVHEGGVVFEQAGPVRFAYNVAYNLSEVYSASRLINWVNNAALSSYMRYNYDFNLTSNATSPFLRLRSYPFVSRTIGQQKVVDDGKKFFIGDGEGTHTLYGVNMDDVKNVRPVIKAILGIETSFSFHIGLILSVLATVTAVAWVKERDLGTVAQLRRSGLLNVVYWFYNFMMAYARFAVSILVILGLTAAFGISYLRGMAFLFYTFLIFTTVSSTISIVSVLIRMTTFEDVASRIPALIVLMQLLPSLLAQFGPGIIGSTAWAQWLLPVCKYSYYAVPVSIIPFYLKDLGQVYADNAFQPATFATLLKAMKIDAIVLLVHMVLWPLLFLILERFNLTIQQHQEKLNEHESASWTAAPAPPIEVSGGLPSHIDSQASVPKRKKKGSRKVDPSDMFQRLDEEAEALAREEDLKHGVVVRNLTKRFPYMPRRVVDDLNLTVPRGRSAALLGPSHAGKSTALHLLIGDEASNTGTLEISGVSAIGMNRNRLYNLTKLGTSLQRNSLLDWMTVREHVELFLTLRNSLDDFDLPACTIAILRRAKLSSVAETKTMDLNISDKKKLTVALATLTFSETLVLDEPTTGCNLAARNTIWDMIRVANKQKNKSLVLTTNSILEATTLADEIGILVNGQLVSRGTPHYMTTSCSHGYELKIWLAPTLPSLDAVQSGSAFSSSSDLLAKPPKSTKLGSKALQQTSETANAIQKLEASVIRPLFQTSYFRIEREKAARNRSICVTFDIPQIAQLDMVYERLNQALLEGQFIDYRLSQMSLATAYRRIARQQLDEYSTYVRSANCLVGK